MGFTDALPEMKDRAVQVKSRFVRERLPNFKPESVLMGFLILLITILVLLPTLILVIFSFTPVGLLDFDALEFTLQHYRELFTDPAMIDALINTLIVAVGTTLFALITGGGIAWIVYRTNTPYVRRFKWMVLLPFFVSPLILAIAWQGLANQHIGLLNAFLDRTIGMSPLNIFSLWGMVWVMGIYYTIFTYLYIGSTLANMDSTLAEAAKISGGNTLSVTRHITLPLMAPSISSSAIFVFVLSASQFAAPALLGVREGEFVLATKIYEGIVQSPPQYGLAGAAAVLLIIITSTLMILRLKYIEKRDYTTIGGGSESRRRIDVGKWKYACLAFFFGYIMIGVLLPIGMVVLMSFYQYPVPYPTMDILTTQHWDFVLGFSFTRTAIKNSVFLALAGGTIGVLLGALLSWNVNRSDSKTSNVLDSVSLFPIALPAIVVGVAYLWLLLPFPWAIYGTIWAILIAYIARYFPYASQAIDGNIRQIEDSMEEVAYVTGASRLTAFRKIILPLIKPGVFAGFLLLYTTFIRQLSISVFLYDADSIVISVLILDFWFDGRIPEMSVIAVIQITLTIVGILLITRLFNIGIEDSLNMD
jgi:iron(III) transport system permease protein